MTGDTFAMSQEIIELQTRVAELSVALERVTEQRDNAMDAAESLHQELEACRDRIKSLGGQLDRLRIHIQQGIELWSLSASTPISSVNYATVKSDSTRNASQAVYVIQTHQPG